jgi:hypothetical protein
MAVIKMPVSMRPKAKGDPNRASTSGDAPVKKVLLGIHQICLICCLFCLSRVTLFGYLAGSRDLLLLRCRTRRAAAVLHVRVNFVDHRLLLLLLKMSIHCRSRLIFTDSFAL